MVACVSVTVVTPEVSVTVSTTKSVAAVPIEPCSVYMVAPYVFTSRAYPAVPVPTATADGVAANAAAPPDAAAQILEAPIFIDASSVPVAGASAVAGAAPVYNSKAEAPFVFIPS